MCVQAVIENNQTAHFQMQCSYEVGWLGIGIGQGMVGSDLMIFWPYYDSSSQSNYSTTMSRRQASAFIEPNPISDQSAISVTQHLTVDYNAKTVTFAFSRPVTVQENALSLLAGGQEMVWAYATTRPDGNDPYASLLKHIDSGTFLLKLDGDPSQSSSTQHGGSSGTGSSSSNSTSSSSNTTDPFSGFPGFQNGGSGGYSQGNGPGGPMDDYDKFVIAHAALMFFALAVMIPFAIMFPAAMRNIVPSSWFPAHATLQLGIVLPCLIAGFVLAIKASLGYDWKSRHQKLGLAIFVLIFVQMAIGIVSHMRYRRLVATNAQEGLADDLRRAQRRNSSLMLEDPKEEIQTEGPMEQARPAPAMTPSRPSRPRFPNILHFIIGYAVPLLVLVQIPFGLQEYGPGSTPKAVWTAWWVWTGVLMVAWAASIINRARGGGMSVE